MEAEEWKELLGYEGIYLISSYGRIKSISRQVDIGKGKLRWYFGRDMRLSPNTKGYLQIVLVNRKGIRKTDRVHRLVAKTFIPNPDNKSFINHKDLNKKNNYYCNLEWCTHQENLEHAWRNGKLRKGVDIPSSKLTEEQVLQIRKQYLLKQRGVLALTREFRITRKTVANIIYYRSWKHLS